MISTNNIEKAKKLIKSEEKPIIVKAQDDSFNRAILEYGKFNTLLFSFKSLLTSKDSLRSINSSANHILAHIACKNNISLGYDLSGLLDLNKKEKAQALVKLKQNIKICRKAKTKIKLLNYKDKKDALGLLVSIGASTQQAKEAIE